jgi:hypothetical protein
MRKGANLTSSQEPNVMRSIALVIALVAALIAPAFAQKAEIEAVNAKWIDFFNKGDFPGVASHS